MNIKPRVKCFGDGHCSSRCFLSCDVLIMCAYNVVYIRHRHLYMLHSIVENCPKWWGNVVCVVKSAMWISKSFVRFQFIICATMLLWSRCRSWQSWVHCWPQLQFNKSPITNNPIIPPLQQPNKSPRPTGPTNSTLFMLFSSEKNKSSE